MANASDLTDMTPDGRYLIVRGRLWRTANPFLQPDTRQKLVDELMEARRAVRTALRAGETNDLETARARVHAAKVALGERGEVWWTDGAPDFNRHLVKNTPYSAPFEVAQGGAEVEPLISALVES